MRLLRIAVAALAIVPAALAVDSKRQVLVWFEGKVPASVVEKTRQACVDAGAQITHVFTLMSGFSAVAPESALDAVRMLRASEFPQYNLRIDDDGEVKTFAKRMEQEERGN